MSGARRALTLALVAVLGIALAAAITWGTSQLVRQRIGLASQPLTAGSRLLPPVARRATTSRTPAPAAPGFPRSQPTQEAPPPAASAPNTPSVPAEAPAASGEIERPARSTGGTGAGEGGDTGSGSARRDD